MEEEARAVLESFGWGEEFLKINKVLLEGYADCESSEEILEVQQMYLQEAEVYKKAKEKRQEEERNGERGYIDSSLFPSDSDEFVTL